MWRGAGLRSGYGYRPTARSVAVNIPPRQVAAWAFERGRDEAPADAVLRTARRLGREV
jgi:hypothetical protein